MNRMNNQNNVSAVKRRKERTELLGSYADAAGSLYSALSVSEFVTVFNHYEDDKTDENETVIELHQYLKMKPDAAEFSIWKDIIAGPMLHPDTYKEDLKNLKTLRAEQHGKPRYLPPSKDAFLKYADSSHIEPIKPYAELKTYILKKGLKDKDKLEEIDGDLLDIHELIQDLAEPTEILHYFIEAGYPLDDIDDMNSFLQRVAEVFNNTRLFENNGFTPNELDNINEGKRPKEIVLHQPKKVGRNDPCPCGSGKKYKRCCALTTDTGAAQLSQSECKLFYETWYKLLDYVNRKLKVVDYTFSLSYPDCHDELLLHKIREQLWKKPRLISEFIADSVNRRSLSDEEISLLQSWEKQNIKGQFILGKYTSDAAIFMHMDKNTEQKLYAVKGMTSSIAESMHRTLPVVLETVLLPFKDTIIYDSYMVSLPVEFDGRAIEMFEVEYAKSVKKFGITTKLR